MAVSSIRSRQPRSGRMRGRNDSGEENVPLDLCKDPAENLQEILKNVSKQQGVSNMRKLGHLNNFVKLLCSVGHLEETLRFTHEEMIICLRVALLNEAKEVRAAGLRALRYLITDSGTLEKVLCLQVDYLIARCIDIQQSNEVERTQGLRLVRKMITVDARLVPSSVTNSLIAVGNDGHHVRDRMMRACIAIICELSLKNPVVVAQAGGLSTILKSVTDCQLSRINEALITTVLHLLNHPHTRQYVRSDVELEQILAPYTDFHYRHSPGVELGQLKEDRDAKFLASKMSIAAAFRSWSGIINLCKSGNSGIQSLIGLLCIPNMEVRKALLEVLYDIFQLTIPVPSTDFTEALNSVDSCRFQDDWRLSDGFVVSEAKTILPHRSCSRPDLMHNYLAFVLSAFIRSGLLEGLVEVITSSDDVISIRATVLLGELLHMANTILPHSHSHPLHCLPSLMNMAASFDITPDKRLRASAAVNNLKCFHEKKKRGPKPSSLYLDHILRTSGASLCSWDQHSRLQRDFFIIKVTEDALMTTLKDSHILSHKESLDWDWSLIGTILKWSNVSLRSNKDEQMHTFVRRLLFFYKPSSNLYGSLELDHPKARQLTVVGCQFTEFLMESEEEGQGFLEDLVRNIVQWLFSHLGPKPNHSLQSNSLLTTLSQYYLLFLGTLSAHPHGVKMLEKCSVFQCLLNLCTVKHQEHLLKLTVTTLNYGRDGLPRVILSKILTAATDSCRLYATKHLRVLLRANVEFFSSWGIELLVTQLHDRNKAISLEALDILDEACGDKANLHALIELKPALTHLGDKGLLLLLRFLSIPKGFSYLHAKGVVAKQMEKWQKYYNLKYVDMIEEQLNEALTTYRKPVNGDNYVRRSNQRRHRPHVYLPVHLYGQLVHSKPGCHQLEAQNVVHDLSYNIRAPKLDHWDGIKQLKAALWALGNIGSSNWGLNLLLDESVIPDIVALAYHCEVLSIRGTCVYVLGLMSKTKHGCEVLKQEGWDSVRHSRSTLWPVVPEEVEAQPKPYTLLSSVPSTLSLTDSTSSKQNSDSDSVHPSETKPCSDRLRCSRSAADHLSSFAGVTFNDGRLESWEFPEESLYAQMKDQPSAGSQASSGLRPRLIHSLSLPVRRPCTAPDPKHTTQGKSLNGKQHPSAEFTGDLFGLDHALSTYRNGHLCKSPSGGKEITVDGMDASDNQGSTPSIGEGVINGSVVQTVEPHRELRALGSESCFKSRSQSLNTNTATSSIFSLNLSESRETLASSTDCLGLKTVIGSQTFENSQPLTLVPQSIPKSCSAILIPPGSSHTLPRRAQSLKCPSVTPLSSGSPRYLSGHNSCTSSRDALGYATLRRLQHQRIQASLSHSEALASPAKDILFTDAITMNTGSADYTLTSKRFLKALSYASFDKEDLLSPINQSTLQRSSSVRSLVSTAAYGSSDDYIGLALPVDINCMFQVNETPYFQEWLNSDSEDCSAKLFSSSTDGCGPARSPFTELVAVSRPDPRKMLGSEDTGLQEHNDNNCLYCTALCVLGLNCHNSNPDLTDGAPPAECCSPPAANHLDLTPSKLSGVRAQLSVSSDGVSLGSAGSGRSTEHVLGVKSIPEDAPAGRVRLRKEVLRLIINLSSSVGTKNHETSLLTVKEKFPYAFDDICLYSEVSYLLAHCTFRLPARRFIQELFQDGLFAPMYEVAESMLSKPQQRMSTTPPSDR